jgi:hypothetical protein
MKKDIEYKWVKEIVGVEPKAIPHFYKSEAKPVGTNRFRLNIWVKQPYDEIAESYKILHSYYIKTDNENNILHYSC